MESGIKINQEHTLHDLTGIAHAVMPLAKQLLGKRGFFLVDLLTSWQQIVGENLARYTLPYQIVFRKDERINGCLTLLTLSGAFAMEIKQKERQILDKVNAYFGYEAIASLKIMQTGNADDFPMAKKPIENLKKNVVSAGEENYITELTKNVQSADLREILQRLGQAVISENKLGE